MSEEKEQGGEISRPNDEKLIKDLMIDLGRGRGVFDGFHEMCRMAQANPFVMMVSSFLITDELKHGFPELYELAVEVNTEIAKGERVLGDPRLHKKLREFARQRHDLLAKFAEKYGVKVEKPEPKSNLIIP